ncbi:hypothetical protein N1028_11760 [Herbiconiux sp. CPCC 203407]|uniref:Uncharacterized protein n=1 Tax=Herbiconiux oxytropis TaxID=2970915 RepID=A0AA41XHT1_9MICO|nr:hypothetical protein [Herbiconiux oxytropis]MCS5723991.1 hypothetical protein [Herbiconiux oxytropis]MCS5726569.1 hypothetical protein [Herbiconiux oxytropis]
MARRSSFPGAADAHGGASSAGVVRGETHFTPDNDRRRTGRIASPARMASLYAREPITTV